MAHDADHVWRLPGTVIGGDMRLSSPANAATMAPSVKNRLRRIVNRAPEAVVRLTGRTRGGAAHLKAHLDYVTRNGRLVAETQDGQRITDRASLRRLHDDWMLANLAQQRGHSGPNAAQSVAFILSMPPGTSADRVEAAARAWARETFRDSHDWLMARHDDTSHPHVHVTVRAVGRNGRRLAPGPGELQQWRERFARELRYLGVEAEATPRQARGIVAKSRPMAGLKQAQRGVTSRFQKLQEQAMTADARAPAATPPNPWSRAIQVRQDAIRRAYLTHAEVLSNGNEVDRRLARDIHRFVAAMPIPLTRRQALVVELRQVLQRKSAGPVPSADLPGLAEEKAPKPRSRTLQRPGPLPSPDRSRGR